MDDNEESYELLATNENTRNYDSPPRRIVRRRINKRKMKKIIVFVIIISVCGTIIFSASSLVKDKYEIKSSKNSYINRPKSVKIDDFVSATDKEKGPITIDIEKNDGTKINLYEKMVNRTDDNLESFYIDYNSFEEANSNIETIEKYFCEKVGIKKGYQIECPDYNHLIIHYGFYGRHTRDRKHCAIDKDGKSYPDETLVSNFNKYGDCGNDVSKDLKESCNGEVNCNLRASNTNYGNTCTGIHKYLHVKYHCEKDKEIKIPKFAIVMFANIIKPNTVYEHSVSEFYQYADIHGYSFILNTKRYDNERNFFYMKLHSITEAITHGLKTKEFDWILWTDSDVVLANPNIKLEAFIPKDNNIHFIATTDHHGLNAGVFLIRVCSWSLNFLMRAITYQYYFNEDVLEFSDQSALNNVLVKFNEEDHYVIVPSKWFNKYPNNIKTNDFNFIIHFAGKKNKDELSSQIRNEIYSDPKWGTGMTNKQLREIVLKYYEEQTKPEKKKKLKMQLMKETSKK